MKLQSPAFLAFALVLGSARAQSTLFQEGAENGLGAWTVSSLGTCYWGHGKSGPCAGTFFVAATSDPCSAWAAPFPEGLHSIRFGIQGQCTYEHPDPNAVPFAQIWTANEIAIPATGTTRLRFWSKSETENDSSYDRRIVAVEDGISGSTILAQLVDSGWYVYEFDLTAWSGRAIRISFRFVGEDNQNNAYRGWYLDQISVDHTPAASPMFCFGDGSATPCPCGNSSAVGADAGCSNSLGIGATVRVSGSASLAADSVVLDGASMPDSSALYFQGAGVANGGAGVVFGDGLKCTIGPFVRLGTELNVGGASRYPASGDLPVSVKGLVGQPGTRHYQVRYRNAADFCTSETFNYTNAVTVVWSG